MYTLDLKSFVRRYLIPDVVPLPATAQFGAALAGFLALTCTFLAVRWLFPEAPSTLLCGPLAASTVLLFVLPYSPVAQPWPVVGGSFLSSLIGLTAGALIDSSLWAALVAVPAVIILMNTLRCLHPPGAASAAMFATTYSVWAGFGVEATVEVLLLHLTILLSAAVCLNKWLLQHPYPHIAAVPKTVHKTEDPPPLARVGIRSSDLHQALKEIGTFMDVSETDLKRIYELAARYALQRHTDLICADIMTQDVVAIEPTTKLEEAWALLRRHRIKALPVLNQERRIVGIVTVADFLKHFDSRNLLALSLRVKTMLKRTQAPFPAYLRTAGTIMSSPVVTIPASMPVVELMSRLSDEGRHHLPIVDERLQLCGMVTQSDLIAALYHQLVLKGIADVTGSSLSR